MIFAAPESVWSEAESFLLQGRRERFGFFLCGVACTSKGPRFCVQEFAPIEMENVERGPDIERRVDLDALLDKINKAKREGLALVEIHTHPFTESGVTFSHFDDLEMPEFASYVLDSLDGRPYGALVLGHESVDGRYWTDIDEASPIERILIAGETFDHRAPTSSPLEPKTDASTERYDRQVRLFGNPGQERLSQLTVGVVGAGGIGSHVIQQLAYMGVRRFRLVDPDRIERSNLNRTIGAVESDVGHPKVGVAERVVDEIGGGENTDTTVVQKDLKSELAIRTLLSCDIVCGCMDNDGGRQILNDLARAAHIPYIDFATGIETAENADVTEIGGRVAVVQPDGPCLHCMDEIDLREARYFLKPAEERDEDQKAGYIDPEWNVPNPAIVSLNGVVASQGVNELMLYATGMDRISSLFYYYLREAATESQRCAARRVASDSNCYTCTLRGIGDQATFDRYSDGRE